MVSLIKNELGVHTCATTVRKALKSQGLKAYRRPKKPLLNAKNRKCRMEWAQKHKEWTIEDWKMVIWSDETKVNRIGSDGMIWGWKKSGVNNLSENSRWTRNFGGGSVTMWGCITYYGVGYACWVKG